MIEKVEMKSEVGENKPDTFSYKPSEPTQSSRGFRNVLIDVHLANELKQKTKESINNNSEYSDVLSELIDTMCLM